MDDRIRFVVARFFSVPETDVTDAFVFPPERLQGSVGRATLHSALKRMAGVDLPAAFTANTYAQLISPNAQAPQAPNPQPRVPAARSPQTHNDALAIGLDIESVDNSPSSGDPWSDAFYTDNFTPAEIAYCIRQPDPKLSFCGLWSAKEAAIKCGQEFAGLRPIQIEITHDATGKPILQTSSSSHQNNAIDCVVSISHSARTAAAVCVKLPRSRNSKPAALSTLSEPAQENNAAQKSVSSLRWLIWLNLALTALIILLLFAWRR